MPYKVSKVKGDGYRVANRETGKVHAKGTSKAKADAQIRLLNAKEHNPGWTPTGKKAKRGKK